MTCGFWQQTQYRIKIMFSKKIPVSIIKIRAGGEKKEKKWIALSVLMGWRCPHLSETVLNNK